MISTSGQMYLVGPPSRKQVQRLWSNNFYPVAWHFLCDCRDLKLAPKSPSLNVRILSL